MGNDKYGHEKTIETANCQIQAYIDIHNKRIKLKNYSGNEKCVISNIKKLCSKNNMGKIICNVPKSSVNCFLEEGFVQEGIINGFFKGENAYCVSFFNSQSRAESERIDEENAIIKKADELFNQYSPNINNNFNIRTGTTNDVEQLSQLFSTVFKTYPTPMDKPNYIKKLIENNEVIFKVAEENNKIISAASADIDKNYLNAEITDCATYEQYRGKGLLSELIYHLEKELQKMNYITLYSLARALSPGMNIVLSKHGYKFTGRHINNCNIMGKFEDMNIWVKKVRK